MNNFEVVIGIEIHIALNTKYKMFSYALNQVTNEHNKNVAPHDLGYPGILPIVNFDAVRKALILGHAFNMDIAKELTFDRKHYFYYDLPKGYQITQYKNPIGVNGSMDVFGKKIPILQIQLEEDTAKSYHHEKKILLDFSRAGVPLIEIVTMPVFHDADTVAEYIRNIQVLVRNLDISSAKLESGSMRADVNISLKLFDDEQLGTKVEIKNLNSISNIKKAIAYEIYEQTENLLYGKLIESTTKKFDEKLQKTVVMRLKNKELDYRFLVEPNIPPVILSEHKIFDIDYSKIEMPQAKRNRYGDYGLTDTQIDFLLFNPKFANLFDEFKYSNKVKVANIFFQNVMQLITNIDTTNYDSLITFIREVDSSLIDLESGSISSKQIKVAISKMFTENLSYSEVVEKYDLKQISDESFITKKIYNIIEVNSEFLNKNKLWLDRIQKFIIGQLMRETAGKCNPVVAKSILEKILGEILV